ncbi:zinc finger CCHC domain-containing protein 24-like [Harmonia axyridis]|uniref:zinc finger CCHC domain-containing protein 24-like n=1 Tax=Harmonia axyridis TaxID=115357 RepID=UPI001E278D92|nr:zinc finger CCHC domain-containing protein 24-like [Harmonia axyridis]
MEGVNSTLGKKVPCYGKFECEKCKNAWASACCWKDKHQICKSCGRKVIAYGMTPLHKSAHTVHDLSKKHPQELCEKCIELGYYCRNA